MLVERVPFGYMIKRLHDLRLEKTNNKALCLNMECVRALLTSKFF